MAKLSILPKDKKFSILLEQSANNALRTAQQLRDMVSVWENVGQRVSIIGDLEHDGDAITHQVMTELRRAFVVPFDREDMALLARSLDNVSDFVHSAADAMWSYKVDRPTERVKELADILLAIAAEVEQAIHEVFERTESGQLDKRCEGIHLLENRGDDVYKAALAELFDRPADVVSVIKWRDIYKHVETAIDSCEGVATIVEGMAVKYG